LWRMVRMLDWDERLCMMFERMERILCAVNLC
jgi:hypothetical protein